MSAWQLLHQDLVSHLIPFLSISCLVKVFRVCGHWTRWKIPSKGVELSCEEKKDFQLPSWFIRSKERKELEHNFFKFVRAKINRRSHTLDWYPTRIECQFLCGEFLLRRSSSFCQIPHFFPSLLRLNSLARLTVNLHFSIVRWMLTEKAVPLKGLEWFFTCFAVRKTETHYFGDVLTFELEEVASDCFWKLKKWRCPLSQVSTDTPPHICNAISHLPSSSCCILQVGDHCDWKNLEKYTSLFFNPERKCLLHLIVEAQLNPEEVEAFLRSKIFSTIASAPGLPGDCWSFEIDTVWTESNRSPELIMDFCRSVPTWGNPKKVWKMDIELVIRLSPRYQLKQWVPTIKYRQWLKGTVIPFLVAVEKNPNVCGVSLELEPDDFWWISHLEAKPQIDGKGSVHSVHLFDDLRCVVGCFPKLKIQDENLKGLFEKAQWCQMDQTFVYILSQLAHLVW